MMRAHMLVMLSNFLFLRGGIPSIGLTIYIALV